MMFERSWMPRSPRVFVVFALLFMGMACSREEIVQLRLADEATRAEILVESDRLVRSNGESRNRWLCGWRFARDSGKPAALPTADPAVFEMVSVDPRERTLVLQLAHPGAAHGEVAVVMGRRTVGTFPVTQDREIVLPVSPSRGVVPVSLSFSHRDAVSVRGVRLKAPRRPGAVLFEEGVVSQQGWSLVRWTLPVGRDSRIIGSFSPPQNPRPGQVFAVEVTTQNLPSKEIFRWSATDVEGAHQTAFDVPFEAEHELVRVQLVALGEGEPGLWDVTLESAHTPPHHAITHAPPRAPKAVVVYVMDALRADNVGCFGSTLGATPCIDSLAQEGVRFAQHFSVAPSTVPSTRSLFTGLPLQPAEGIPPGGPSTLAEGFRDAGFRTGCFSSNPALSKDFGLVKGFEQVSFEELDEDFNLGVRSVNDSAARLHSAALDWVQSLGAEDRAFLYLHTLHPHNPYTPPPEFMAKFVALESDLPVGTTRELVEIRDQGMKATNEIQKRIRAAYASGIGYNDALLCGFVDALEERFGAGEILLVLTSDHGEELFDHGGVLHGYTLYDEMLHIPLVIHWPGVITPRTIEQQTGTVDVHATLSSMIEQPGQLSPTGGTSLWTSILGPLPELEDRLVFAAAPGIRDTIAMVRSPRLKVVEAQSKGLQSGMGFRLGRGHDSEYVFDLEKDPAELCNRCRDDDLETDWLRAELRAWRRKWTPSVQPDQPQEIDEATRRRLEALGYVNP